MTSKSQLILHVATEAFVIATLSIFFTKKINTLNKSIDEMTNIIQLVESKLEEQDKFIHLLSDRLTHLEISERQQPDVKMSPPDVKMSPPDVKMSPPDVKPRSSSVSKPQPVSTRDDVILLNIFNQRQKPLSRPPVIEVMDDEKSAEQLDTEIQVELLDLVGDVSLFNNDDEVGVDESENGME